MRRKNIGIIIVLVLAVLLLLSLIFGNPQKRYIWWEDYESNSRQPYSTYFIKELLRDYADRDFEVIRDSIPASVEELDEPASMVFIGGAFPWQWSNERLLDFVKEGNTLFISSRVAPEDLLVFLCYVVDGQLLEDEGNGDFYNDMDYSYYLNKDTVLELYWTDAGGEQVFPVYFRNESEVLLYEWARQGVEHICPCVSSCFDFFAIEEPRPMDAWDYPPDDPVEAEEEGYPAEFFENLEERMLSAGVYPAYEGSFDEGRAMPVFAYIPYGKGRIYLHTVPLAFTNYMLTQEGGFDYASFVFSHLPKGKKIYWARPLDFTYTPPERSLTHFGRTPLKYVLSHSSLAWAWYLLLLSALLYVLFEGKRKQRIMPLLVRPENTSMAFVSLIGQLTFLKGNHRKLAIEMLRLWSGHVHRHYNISLHQPHPNLAETLAARSGVSAGLIDKILSLRRKIENSTYFSEVTLVSLYKLLQSFYENEKRNYA